MLARGNYELKECVFCTKESPENCAKCEILKKAAKEAEHEPEEVEEPEEPEEPIKAPAKDNPQQYTKAMIRKRLEEDDKWLIRGLLAVYERQTLDEQMESLTKHDNSVGFNAFDSQFLSSLAKKFLEKGSLTPPQLKACRKAMLKYSGQLAKIANGELQGEVTANTE